MRNAAAKIYAPPLPANLHYVDKRAMTDYIPTLVLLFAVLLSALALIYVKDLSRKLFIDYQKAEHEIQSQRFEKGRLMIEQSTLATQARVERVAKKLSLIHI